MKIISMPLLAATTFLFTDLGIAAQSKPKSDGLSSVAKDTGAVSRAAPALDAGMTAEEVLRVVGKPAEIKPLETPEGKAETWIYRRQVGKQTMQEAIPRGSTVVAAAGLVEGALATPPPLEFRTRHTTTYQVTSLLMYEGQLIKAKQSLSEVVSYDR